MATMHRLAGPATALFIGTLLAAFPPVSAGAQGSLTVRGRVLLNEEQAPEQQGPTDACSTPGPNCDVALTRLLSMPSPGTGKFFAGAATDSAGDTSSPALAIGLELNLVAAALPGGDLTIGRLEFSSAASPRSQVLNGSLIQGEGLFFCQSDGTVLPPLVGTATHACRPSAIVGIDLGVLSTRWTRNTHQIITEWLRLGPAFELLANGFSFAHLMRSLQLAPLIDVRTSNTANSPVKHTRIPRLKGDSNIGIGGRLGILLRSPAWESRMRIRYRTVLWSSIANPRTTDARGELSVSRHFLYGSALLTSVGLQLAVDWTDSRDPTGRRNAIFNPHSTFVGLTLGWRHAPPHI